MTHSGRGLIAVSAALKRSGFPTNQDPVVPSTRIQRCAIELGPDSFGRKLPLYMQLVEPDPASENHGAMLLQFASALPFRCTATTVADTVRFVLYLNGLIELPAFGFDAIEGMVTFRYALLCGGDGPDAALTVECVQRIKSNLRRCTDYIEGVASGRMTLEQAIASHRSQLRRSPTRAEQHAHAGSGVWTPIDSAENDP